MLNNEVFLLKDNVPFVFDRKGRKLFRISGGNRIEIGDENFISSLVTSNAAVITAEQAQQISLETD